MAQGGAGYFNSPNGCSSDFATIGIDGGGGGGGAGGNGGKIVIRYNGAFPSTITKNVAGGSGGSGGFMHYSGPTCSQPGNGPAGSSGSTGAVDIAGF